MRERLITIDINKVNFKILKYKQFDNNNILKVEIIEKGKLIDLSGYSAYFFFKLPSGEILQKNTTIEDNKIKVFLDSGVFSESGRVKVEITLSNAEQIVTTFTMYFEIEETIDRNEAIQSKPEWDIISDILNGTGGTGGTGGSIDISNKVDKEEGKGLISLSEIERLANVDNYDDTEIRELIKEKADKEDLHEHENKDILDEITEEKIEQWNKGGFSGDYNDLINKPTIPSIEGLATESYVKNEIANAQLDGGDVDLSGYATKDDLHEHTNKNILDNITSEKVNDWDNKSEFDGDYNSLTNKPTIPSLVGYATESYVKNEIANAQLNSDDNEVDLSGFATKDELNAKADVEDIPTKVSQLENDSNYLTSIPSEYITETELNDKGYLTEHQDISGKVDKEDGKGLISLSEIERLKNVDNYTHPSTHNATMITEDKNHRFVTDEEKALWNNKEEKNHTHKELHEHANKDILNDITSDKIDEWDNKSEFNGDYNSLTNKPTIPSIEGLATETYVQNKIAEAQLSGEEVDLSGFATKDELNTKADVEDIPTKVSQLENDSNYLTSIPSEYITETELNDKGYLTEHQDISGKANKSEIPTKTSQLTNDSGYLTSIPSEYVTDDELNAKGYLTEHQNISGKADKSEIPTKTSQLTNDSGYLTSIPSEYITEEELNAKGLATETFVTNKIAEASLSSGEVDLSGYATKDELNAKANKSDIPNLDGYALKTEIPTVPTKLSQLQNDSNFISSIPEEYITETELNAKGYLTSVPLEYVTEEELESKGYLTEHQDISDKADKSEIPTKTSQLTNDSGFITEHQNISGKADKSYVDTELAKKSDKTHTHSYNDLSDKPVIPSINGLATKKELTDGLATKSDMGHTHDQYLTEHQDISGKANKSDIPTKTSQLTNDSNFVSRNDIPTKTSQLQNDTDFATNASVDEKIANINVPSLEGNALTFGNYTIKYNETNDTLDFIYNGTTEEPEVPPTEEPEVPPTTGDYVTEGLSMYIDATRNSIGDLTANHTITNHGVTHTSDNNYLNFVAGERDYLDTDFTPNLTQWSVELYFYFTKTPTTTQNIINWGVSGNRIKMGYVSNYNGLIVQSNGDATCVISTDSNLLSPHHLIVTMNNGALTSYLDGVKTVLCESGSTQTSHTGTLKIGTKYDATKEFANINLRTFRFYDGKVLTDEEALQNYNYETKINNYVTNGLSLYIDADDVATQGSIRDISGNQTVTNNGVSTTLDNGCLNFVASESDYIDCGFKPNLTQWSVETYFYFTNSETGALLGWGASGNRTAIAIWSNNFMIAINDDTQHTIMPTAPTSLTHLILTYNNGGIIAYVNGVKSQITASANVMSSQAGNLMIGTKYSASDDFGNINLKSLRFYDGKVLTDEEALQNYNYEINRG